MAKEPPKRDEEFGEEETAKRRDEALRRALNMPHKPHKPSKRDTDAKKKPNER